MSRKSRYWKLGAWTMSVIVAGALLWGADGLAQTVPGVPEDRIETDTEALTCWWKSDRSSIRIGEEFSVTLTCRMVETDREKTVVNESLLDPNALVISPYQVKNGRRFKEILRVLPGPEGPVRTRSLQYAYTVRLMGEGFFGKDVPVPPVEIRYHIDLVTNKDTVTPGKERIYLLPPLPMRIQSLVPKAASAIRDGGDGTFGDIERHYWNAVLAFIGAGVFLLVLLLVLLPLLVLAIRQRQGHGFNGTALHDRELLRRLARELDRVQRGCRASSWDEEAIGKVLSVFRVAGALALGRRVVQTPVSPETGGLEGQLKFRKGVWPRTKVLVSASLTPEEMAGELAGAVWQDVGKAGRKALLEETRRSFAVFNAARYAPAESMDRDALNDALDKGERLVRALRHDRLPYVRMLHAAGEWYGHWRRQWKRS